MPIKDKLSKADIEAIVKMYKDDKMSTTDIAETYKVTKNTVRYHLRGAGVKARAAGGRPKIQLDDKKIKRLYESGKSIRQIAGVFDDATNFTVHQRLNEMNVKMRKAGRTKKGD